jgi:hypothetical protein
MTQMTKLAQNQNMLMLDLTKKAAMDAETLKTITLLTLIYLPASFVSVCRSNERKAPTAVCADIATTHRPSWEWDTSRSVPSTAKPAFMLKVGCGYSQYCRWHF